MKLIKPSVQFFGAVPTDYESALKFIEMAGRTCYKSENKITKDSAEKFVKKLIKAGHLAMVEHSNFVVKISLICSPEKFITPTRKYFNHTVTEDFIYIGGNLTAWYNQGIESNWDHEIFEPFKKVYGSLFEVYNTPTYTDSEWQVCSHNEIPPSLHRYSAKFICDRGVSHELVRHRPCSFAQESTRYVNYDNKNMEFIEPIGFEEWTEKAKNIFSTTCVDAMENYHQLIYNNDLTPQQARAILPNALKTELIVTADADEWKHIRNLRTAKAAHPDMQRVMNMMPWNDFL